MNDAADEGPGVDVMRPPCPRCGQPYPADEVAQHTEPVDCGGCHQCRGMPACFACGFMYCACDVHEHG
jgi:hypothetical protein